MTPSPSLPAQPSAFGARSKLVLAIGAACVWAAWQLELDLDTLFPDGRRLQILEEFFAAAVIPDLSGVVMGQLVTGVCNTIAFATAAMALALVAGMVLGFFASTAWWSEDDNNGSDGTCVTCLRCTLCPAIFILARVVIAVFRSIHELFWAVIFLVALGLNPMSGVIAIAIPYGCTLAKVFAEMIDEAPRDAAIALRGVGASAMQVYCFGLLPRAAADMTAYAFYRFECTLRSAAILGFFGFETLGYFIRLAFEETLYGQCWTFLYALLALVVTADWWSGAFRRSFVT